MCPNWRDTLDARARGAVEGFHDHDASQEEIRDAEQAARDADRPEAAHAVAKANQAVVDGGPTEAETLARLAEAPLEADREPGTVLDRNRDGVDDDPGSDYRL